MAFEKVASLGELTDQRGFRVDVDGVPICLVRLGDTVKAIHDTCSHQDYSLAEGYVFDGQIECALHGSMFDLDNGTPESLPATASVPVFPVQMDGDTILIDVQAQTNDAPMPQH